MVINLLIVLLAISQSNYYYSQSLKNYVSSLSDGDKSGNKLYTRPLLVENNNLEEQPEQALQLDNNCSDNWANDSNNLVSELQNNNNNSPNGSDKSGEDCDKTVPWSVENSNLGHPQEQALPFDCLQRTNQLTAINQAL